MLRLPNRFLLLALLAIPTYHSIAQTTDSSISSMSNPLRCVRACCCTTDLTPAGVMISHVHTKKEWMISYRFMDMYMSDLVSGAQVENKEHVFEKYQMAPEKMNMQMHMLMGMYGITDRLTAMLMLQYQVNSMEMSMYAMNHVHNGVPMNSLSHTMYTTGVADIKLHALYGFIQKSTYQLLGSLGISVPSGSIHEKGDLNESMYPGMSYPYGMQLGSGTVDLLPGVSYLHQNNKLATGVTASAILRTYKNSQNYQLGNEANLNGWIAYQWLPWISSSLRVEGNIAGPITGYDPQLYTYIEPSTNPANYGGKRAQGFLGSSIHFKGALRNNRLGVEYGLPFYQNLNGIQLKQQFAWHAFWSFTF
jgi:hypothetical protein